MDLLAAPKAELIRIINEQVDTIKALETQVAHLHSEIDRLKQQNTSQKKIIFKANTKPKPYKRPKFRGWGISRVKDEPTRRVFHSHDVCPGCGSSLGKPTVAYSRQVIELPQTPVEVIEHVVFKRWCARCKRQVTPPVDLSGQTLGKSRIGIRLMSIIALLRDRCRLPIRVIQLYFKLMYGFSLSRGEVMEIVHTVAAVCKPTYDGLLPKVRSSPVVFADETGGRENGKNGYFWSFSTNNVHLLMYRKSRSAKVVEEIVGDQSEHFNGVIVSDFYAAYNTYLGFHQRCWVHLLRDIHELEQQYPDDQALSRWADRVYAIYQEAVSYPGPAPNLPVGLAEQARIDQQHYLEQKLLNLARPYVKSDVVMATLCGRIITFLPELFTFIRFPEVLPDNNQAERILRHTVIARKISGGTRSEKGSQTKSILTSLFDTWKLQNLDSLTQCQLLLANYQ